MQVVDRQTAEPLEGALVMVLQQAGPKQVFVSDASGTVLLPAGVELPAQVEVMLLGYSPATLQLSTTTRQIALMQSSRLLDEVVVTGQYLAQSAKNSVYKVRTINRKEIEARGATTVQEVLTNELNIRFSQDFATGTANLNLQGLSGQAVKVLLDGVPITGRSGVANEVDINQINLAEIEQIEIVEGPMAVSYGADALAGVINLISRKAAGNQLSVEASMHTESVGNEYSLFDEGIHSPSLSIGYGIDEHWSLRGSYRLNRYGGWQGTGEGRDKSWYPRTQHQSSAQLAHRQERWELYYRLDLLDETLSNLGAPNDQNPLRDAFAIDEAYESQRAMHQLQGEWTLGQARWSGVVAFTDYERQTRQFSTNLVTGVETPTVASEQDTIYYQTLFTRQTLSNLTFELGNRWSVASQAGLEANWERAGGSTLSDGEKAQAEVAAFVSAELSAGPRWTFRPGVRVSHHSIYAATPTPSFNVLYRPGKQMQFRLAYGRGFRAPSTRELYHEFIDANHTIVGNEELQPETSHQYQFQWAYTWLKTGIDLDLSLFYNDVSDQITFFQTDQVNQATSYINLLRSRTTGLNFSLKGQQQALQWSTGIGWLGFYQDLYGEDDVPRYLFTPSANASVAYQWKKPGLDLALFYRFTGPQQAYQQVGNGTDQSVELRRLDGFHWLDCSITKRWGKGISLSAGLHNALNVQTVNNSLSGDTAHGGGGNGQQAVAYGRSWFVRLNYQFSKTTP